MEIPTLKKWHRKIRKTLPPNKVNRFYALTKEERQEIIDLRLQGKALKVIAIDCGVSFSTITKIMREIKDEQS